MLQIILCFFTVVLIGIAFYKLHQMYLSKIAEEIVVFALQGKNWSRKISTNKKMREIETTINISPNNRSFSVGGSKSSTPKSPNRRFK